MTNTKLIVSNGILIGACVYGCVSGAVSGKMWATAGCIIYGASGAFIIAVECCTNNSRLRTFSNHTYRVASVAGIDLILTDVCIASGIDDKLALVNLIPPAVDLIMYYVVDSTWDLITQYTHIVSVILFVYFGFRDSKYILLVAALGFLFALFGNYNYQLTAVQLFNAFGIFCSSFFLGGKDIQDLNVFK